MLPPPFALIAGLGNPGREYEGTRHNIGFMILDRLAASAETTFRVERSWKAALAKSGDVLLCKPLSFMNASGDVVGDVAQFYKVPPAAILVVLDDMALPLGKLRLRATGSAGGHNGLASIIERFGTEAVPRLRVGIGMPENRASVNHVLGRFSPEELPQIAETLARAADAIATAQRDGMAAAMNLFNA
jgi:PTH1 family peptidyl-tRNA hydrolase